MLRSGSLLGLVLLSFAACSSQRAEDLRTAAAGISGGVLDPGDSAVVGIADNASGATCTGSLIAPNLVLTAQHCVAALVGNFDCATVTFGPTKAASDLYVTTKPKMSFTPSDYHPVADVLVPGAQDLVCGNDVALLVLADTIAPAEAAPVVPRVDLAAMAAEIYSAVGFGATDDNGTGAGERRRRDGLAVDCAGTACGSSYVAASEWVGEAGVCGGDSGGPALDSKGRVIGVASRGAVGCVSPTYGDVAAHADWLMSSAKDAASLGGYPPPPWATGASTDPGDGGAGGAGSVAASATAGAGATGGVAGTGAAGGSAPEAGPPVGSAESDGGCHGGRGRPDSAWLVLAALLALSRTRRSR